MKNHSQNFFLVKFLFFSLIFGQDPQSIDWKQINTDRYQIIFPSELKSEANRVANTMENIHEALYDSLGNKWHQKIPIILSNRGAVPNGYVRQAPWMTEWYNVPYLHREMGHTEWYQNLAIHEGRHIVQFNKMNRGVSGILGTLFGQNTQSLYTNFLIPIWYWEGDAVDIETALTHSGRGRSAYFSRTARSYILSGKPFTYRNALYGSYKNEYTNHYELGYYLTSHVKKEYGQNAWDKIIGRTLKWPFISNPIYPLSHSIKSITGSSLSQIYYDTFYDLEIGWKIQLSGLKTDSLVSITPYPEITTHYRYPAMHINGSIIALKSGFGNVTSIVTIKNGDEKLIAPIHSSANLFGYHSNGKQAVWSAYDPDKRWDKRSWSNVRIMDLNSGAVETITNKKRLYQPSISSSGDKISAVTFTENRISLLVVLDSKTGEIIDQVESPNSGLIMKPSWSKDGSKIVFTSQKYNGRALYVYRLKERLFDVILPESWQHISNPIFYSDYIVYETQINGIDQLGAVHTETKKSFRVTSRKIGAYNPSITPNGELLFNDYSFLGDGIGLLEMDPSKWEPISTERKTVRTGYFTEYQSESIFDKDMPYQTYQVTNYDGFESLLNFHSRYIFGNDFNPMIGIKSDNILGTVSLNGELIFNQNENTREKRIRSTIKKYYPIIDLEFKWMDRKVNYGKLVQQFNEGQIEDSLVFNLKEYWSESVINFGATVPLQNRIDGISNRFSFIKVGSNYTLRKKTMYYFDWLHIPPNVRVVDEQSKNDRNGGILPIYVELAAGVLNEKSKRDLGDRGWQFYSFVGGSPFGGIWQGNQISLRLIYGQKGFADHDYINTQIQYESNQGDYIFLSKYNFPSGYQWTLFKTGWQGRIRYGFPLAYPDWSAPYGATYVKRVRGNIFGHLASVDSQDLMLTMGMGLTFDVGGFFDTQLPLPITLNYFYQPKIGKSGLELVFE